MKVPAEDDPLFDLIPTISEVESMLTRRQLLRDQLATELGHCDRELHRFGAMAHALRELVDQPTVAAVAVRLSEHSWSGTGEQLVTTARAVVAQAWPS